MTLFVIHDHIMVLYFDNYYYLIFRYLHKVFNQKLPQSQLPGDVSYLASDFHKHIQSGAVTSQQFSDPQLLLEAYVLGGTYMYIELLCKSLLAVWSFCHN